MGFPNIRNRRKIHIIMTKSDEDKVEAPAILDPSKSRVLYSADGEQLQKGSQVFFYADFAPFQEGVRCEGTIRRIDFEQLTAVVRMGSFWRPLNVSFEFSEFALEDEGRFPFFACSGLGANTFLDDLRS